MFGSLFKKFVVKITTNVFPNLLFKKSTFLNEPSTTSLRLSCSKNGLTLQCNLRHTWPICGFLLNVSYKKYFLKIHILQACVFFLSCVNSGFGQSNSIHIFCACSRFSLYEGTEFLNLFGWLKTNKGLQSFVKWTF